MLSSKKDFIHFYKERDGLRRPFFIFYLFLFINVTQVPSAATSATAIAATDAPHPFSTVGSVSMGAVSVGVVSAGVVSVGVVSTGVVSTGVVS